MRGKGAKYTFSDVPRQLQVDRNYMEQMKADILRRAEAISSDEDDEGRDNITDDENPREQGAASVRVTGDGSASSGDEEHDRDLKNDPIAVVEAAYIRDVGLFLRDAKTRRSAARKLLKEDTGWADEQIEGWAIMLEKDVSQPMHSYHTPL